MRVIGASFRVEGLSGTIDNLAGLELQLNQINTALRTARKEGNDDLFRGLKQSQELSLIHI